MIVYRYRSNAASYDGASFVVNHRGRDVTAVDAPDGVWQLFLTEGWLILPPTVPLNTQVDAPAPEPQFPEPQPAATPFAAPVTFPTFTGTPIPADYPNRLHYIRDGIETLEDVHALEDDGA